MYQMLWVPDLIFSNEKKGGFHTLTTDNRLVSFSVVQRRFLIKVLILTKVFKKIGNLVICRSGNLYLLSSPGNQDYQNFCIRKVEIDNEKIVFLQLGISYNY